ncbi:hypothetical protein HB364_13915 [Pseudoflavitalea sp. X16]|uniref:hypothetical protein n=1 Tax=Paraflavitalea devenefica TaxID=2716334 RepID=UPI00141E56D2|nr:hypothetical protein [Paraflavitalea devenefica]NII26185.1 hypothetical protein [Paraflavitalea devenefica]
MINISPVVILTSYAQRAVVSLLEEFASFHGQDLEVIFARKWLAKCLGYADLNTVYLQMGDRAPAMIRAAEVCLLQYIMDGRSGSHPLLLGATPLLPANEKYRKMMARVRPFVLHLEVDEETALTELKQRRMADLASIGRPHPHFGAWDNNRITCPCKAGYELLDDYSALHRIREEMFQLNKKGYHSCQVVVDAWPTLQDPAHRGIIKNTIAGQLKISTRVLQGTVH